MKNFLPDTIATFSNNSQKTVASLIKNIKVDKIQVSELVKNITGFSASTSPLPVLSVSREIISSEFFVDIFRDLEIQLSRFFDISNSVSSILNSMTEIMLSKIEKEEKILSYFENYVDNYEFISGNDDLYNFSYIENFDNNINSNEYDSVKVPYTDRGGVPFAENGNGYVDPVSSVFKIGSGINKINILNNIKNTVIQSNYSQYISSESDLLSLFNEDNSDTWNVSIKSPTVLTSSIKNISKYIDYDYSYLTGAKVVVEITFNKEIESDNISVMPSGGNGLHLMQVAIESAGGARGVIDSLSNSSSIGYVTKNILSAPINLQTTVNIGFPLSKIKKAIFIFNQSTYTRSVNSPSSEELVSRSINNFISSSRKKRKNTFSALQEIVISYFLKNNSIESLNRNTNIDSISDYYSCRFPIYSKDHPSLKPMEFLQEFNNNLGIDDNALEFKRSPLTAIVQNIVSQALGSQIKMFKNVMFRDSKNKNLSDGLLRIVSAPYEIQQNTDAELNKNMFLSEEQIIPGSSLSRSPFFIKNKNSFNSYDYSFSLKNIQFGRTLVSSSTNNSLAKASYISNRIEIPGEVYGIKAKINLQENNNKYKTDKNFDIEYQNSYELSISLKENPVSENDWIPLAFSDSEEVHSEMLFINPLNSSAQLRFFPMETSLKVYENQKRLPSNAYSVNKFNKTIILNKFNKDSVYLVSYFLDISNFSQQYIDSTVLNSEVGLIVSGDGGEEGEMFSGTASGNKVVLKNNPYISIDSFVGGSYHPIYGSLAAPTNPNYTPVLVKFDNGVYAINLTNYLDGNFEKIDFYSSQDLLFYQNGKELIFNQQVNIPFRVLYNYTSNFMRFRLIIRNNFPGLFFAGDVNNLIVKMKTKTPDIQIQKLLQLG